MMNNFLPTGVTRYFDEIRDEVNNGLERAFQRHPASRGGKRRGNGRKSSTGEDAGFPWDPFFQAAVGDPAVDIEETDDSIEVTAELPGVSKDHISLDIVGDSLRISGEKFIDREERKGDIFVSERSYGRFSRDIGLPCEVVSDKAEASLKDGVLTIKLPKAESAKARSHRIKVK